jgi:hypothetical protein
MLALDKKSLSERDISSKFITPALVSAKWDLMSQIREEVSFTKGRVIVRGHLSSRGEPKRADYLLYFKPGIPLAVVEAKDNNRAAFEDAYNYMKSGTLLRQVINKLNEGINFNRTEDRHLFGDIYEQILRDLQSAGNAGEYQKAQAAVAEIREKLRREFEAALLSK